MQVIDIEAHAQAPEYVKELLRFEGYPRYGHDSQGRFIWYQSATKFEVRENLLPKLQDVKTRLEDMDKSGVGIQIVSPSAPNCDSFPRELGIKLSKINNDYITGLVTENPDRIVGFGSLPIQDVEASVQELDRMKSLGLKGIMATSNVQGERIDAKKFWPIFERAEKYRLPIFVHPAAPANPEMFEKYHMWGPVFGFGVDAALSALSLIMSGVFEVYPKLMIILGHLGEMIPFVLRRIDFVYLRTPDALPAIRKKPSEYFLSNFYVDTAGILHQPALQCTLESLGSEKILFGSDYPFENASLAVDFVQKSKLQPEVKEEIYWKNISKLLNLK